jgi:hypothetical protein
MLFGFLVLATALILSAVAAFYSIAGLIAIFSAATIPVIIMGGSLELGKIVATVWLHNNWRRAGLVYKTYLIPAVAVLMLITSMGIFGFLSKAHSDQSLVSGDVQAKISIYDEKIKTARENIDANRKALKQMDEAVDQVMGRSSDEKGADKAVAIRRAQQKERGRLLAEIEAYQKTVSILAEERAPIAAEVRKVEAEVGPIKYIAAMVYGENTDANSLEAAVRWVIILLVIVFDPLALTLILAANKQFEWARQGRGGFVHDEPAYPPDDGPLTEEQIAQLKKSVEAFGLPEGEVAVKTELFPKDPSPPGWMYNTTTTTYPSNEEEVEELTTEFNRGRHAYLDTPFVHFENLKPMVAKTEPLPAVIEPTPAVSTLDNNVALTPQTDSPPETAIRQKIEQPPVPESRPNNKQALNFAPVADNAIDLGAPPESGFGTEFPSNPNKGDLFIRVDFLPTRLFKWNTKQWIEIDKNSTDSYTYDDGYIEHLIKKIDLGEYDIEMINEKEQAEIQEYLNKKANDG